MNTETLILKKMKPPILRLCFAFAISLATVAAVELESSLKEFSQYRFGDSKKALHDARLAAFDGANDDKVRAKHEHLLHVFLQSEDTSMDARREACLWLGKIGTQASKPLLVELMASESFTDVAQIALAEMADDPQAVLPPSPPTSSQLIDAIRGDDEVLARMAFESIADGVAKEDVGGWILANIATLPPHRQQVSMNALIRADVSGKSQVVEHLVVHGEGGIRLAAIRALGLLGRPQDVGTLVANLSLADEDVVSAARDGLAMAPEDAVRDELLDLLQNGDSEIQSKAIGVAAARGAEFAGDALLQIATQAANPNAKAAASALGWASAPDAFPRVIAAYADGSTAAVESELQAAVWQLARRQPDYKQAIKLLDAHAKNASEKIRASLHSMARRLETVLPEISLDAIRTR